jgi:hypothetical protein
VLLLPLVLHAAVTTFDASLHQLVHHCTRVAPARQAMLAMWRLILGHGKPRMFAALAAQRAALAAAPRSPAKPPQPVRSATARPCREPVGANMERLHFSRACLCQRLLYSGNSVIPIYFHMPPCEWNPGAICRPQKHSGVDVDSAAPSAAVASGELAAGQPAGSSAQQQQRLPPTRRQWLRVAAGTAVGLHVSSADAGQASNKTALAPGRQPLNPLPCDSGGDGIEMEHLIVGVLLGTPLLFLAPTTLVFHALAALLAAGAAALQVRSRSMWNGCRLLSDGATLIWAWDQSCARPCAPVMHQAPCVSGASGCVSLHRSGVSGPRCNGWLAGCALCDMSGHCALQTPRHLRVSLAGITRGGCRVHARQPCSDCGAAGDEAWTLRSRHIL